MRRHPGAYIAHREALLFLPALLVPLLAIRLNLSAVFHHLHRHGGSAIRLLGLMLLSHPGTWVLISALCGGATIAANVLVLPTLAVTTVWAGRGMCGQLLQVPGVEQPLARVHSALDTLHGNPLLPTPHATVLGEPTSMQQCLAVNIWIAGAVGVVLPLLVLGRWEAAGRCSLYVRRLRQARQAGELSPRTAAELQQLSAREAIWPAPFGLVDACILWLSLALLLQAGLL
ncbi:alpha beta hydrolase [Chlorella sorokiniana]|uniref:Alpha beta hydrolase n=1 Tax=Chlorella sorokiniana TaxID=3076 RepID=A0A2P6TV53_CHLSO|nr:alpha beta hydrolase [Chlorella sorokiniana]|eukprot:PRW57947.1 alpha beta hydrolase [Chlorella sorokiniana]